MQKTYANSAIEAVIRDANFSVTYPNNRGNKASPETIACSLPDM